MNVLCVCVCVCVCVVCVCVCVKYGTRHVKHSEAISASATLFLKSFALLPIFSRKISRDSLHVLRRLLKN